MALDRENLISSDDEGAEQHGALTRRALVAGAFATAATAFFEGPQEAYAAKKKRSYKIIYKLSGGKNPANQVRRIAAGKTLPVRRIKNPQRMGYTFKRWCSNKRRTKPAKNVRGLKAKGRRTLYAKWKPYASWERYLKERLPSIKRRVSRCAEKGDSFVFITDIHWAANAKKSPELIKTVMEQVGISKIFCAGDLINTHHSKTGRSDALESMSDCAEKLFSAGEVYLMRGNHDSNDESANKGKPNRWISDKEYFDIAWAPNTARREALCKTGMMVSHGALAEDGDPHVNGDDEAAAYVPGSYPLCYCVDNKKAKIRYICLDTGHPSSSIMSSAQLSWLTDRVLELKRGWSVLVMGHILFKSKPDDDDKIRLHKKGKKIRATLDGIYKRCKRKGITIIGVVAGHTHVDHHIVSEKGYPLLCVACDCWGKSGDWKRTRIPLYKLGTIEEQVFDVVHINKKKRTITFSRVGYGQDRSFSY